MSGILPLTFLAGHPAFFDPDKKVLAEILPNHAFRITQQGDGKLVSIVASPVARRAVAEIKDEKDGHFVTSFLSLNEIERCQTYHDLLEEGKKILAEGGGQFSESQEVKKRLNTILGHAWCKEKVHPSEVHDGECAAILFKDEEDGHFYLSSFYVTKGTTGPNTGVLESRDDVKWVFKNWNRPDDEGICETTGTWRYDPSQGPSLRPIRMEPADHEWMKDLSNVYKDEASPANGRDLIEKALRLETIKEWKGKTHASFGAALPRPKGKKLLGGVAV